MLQFHGLDQQQCLCPRWVNQEWKALFLSVVLAAVQRLGSPGHICLVRICPQDAGVGACSVAFSTLAC